MNPKGELIIVLSNCELFCNALNLLCLIFGDGKTSKGDTIKQRKPYRYLAFKAKSKEDKSDKFCYSKVGSNN